MTHLPESLSTFVDVLRWRANRHPNRTAFTFLVDGEEAEVHLSYEQLDVQSQSIAANLQDLHAEGERALLLFPHGLDFICAFFGCLYAGVIAVPCQPPRPGRSAGALQAILNDTGARYVLGTSRVLENLSKALKSTIDETNLHVLATDELGQLDSPDNWVHPDICGESDAFLQYTSGSVSQPRGVKVSHRNLLYSEQMISAAFEHDEDSTVVGWLPMYHDMGLIGNVLQPVYIGSRCILLAPASFLQRPIRWLQAISRFRARTSGGPNFAYDLCADKVVASQCLELDLSCWTLAFNGSELVHAHTIDRFCSTFDEYGFRRQAFYPCYGLAEATLLVSGGRKSALPVELHVNKSLLSSGRVMLQPCEDAKAVTLIGCGRKILDESVMIVDPQSSRPSAADQIGEIWVAGSNVCSGYWNNPQETKKIFQARIKNSDIATQHFLRTGDLGFMHDAQLFIVGRRDDVIILRGRNYWPQDLERTATCCHPALRPHRGAAFSINEVAQDQLVLVLELAPRQLLTPIITEKLLQTIQGSVSLEHNLQVDTIVLVKAGTIPITSSGKIRRRLCRQMMLNDKLTVVVRDVASSDTAEQSATHLTRDDFIEMENSQRYFRLELYLTATVANLLRRPLTRIPIDSSLSALGLDSFSMMELGSRIQVDLGIDFPLVHLYEGKELSAIAETIVEQLLAPQSDSTNTLSLGRSNNSNTKLSYGQRALWFLQHLSPHSTTYNITIAAAVQGELDTDLLRLAFQQLIDRHESLSSTFNTEQGEPVCTIREMQEICFIHRNSSEGGSELTEEQMVEKTRHDFDLQRGPLLCATVFTKSAQQHVLVLTAHHLIVDFWSLARLLSELNLIYASKASGVSALLPPLKLRYSDYVTWQCQFLEGEGGERLKKFWLTQLSERQFGLNLPLDRPRTHEPPLAMTQFFEFPSQITYRVKRLAQDQDTSLYTVLLAAWQIVLFQVTNQEKFTIGSLTSGRGTSEFSDVVGYFVNPVVISSDLNDEYSINEVICATKRTVTSALAHSEYPFPLLVEKLGPTRNFGRAPLFRVMFNWQQSPLRQYPGLTALALGCRGGEFELGPLMLKSLPTPHPGIETDMEMALGEVNGRLKGFLAYDSNLFESSSIQRIVSYFLEVIEQVVEQPEQRISSLPFFLHREVQSKTLHPAQRTPEHERTLNELFHRQVENTPDKIALVGDGTYLSYSALDRQTEQVAKLILALRDNNTRCISQATSFENSARLQPGHSKFPLVAILTRQNPQFVVGTFAVLKSGSGFVPLDVHDPIDRLQFVLMDCGIDILITEHALVDKAQKLCRNCPEIRDVIVLSAPANLVSADANTRLHCSDEIERDRTAQTFATTVPDQVVYVVYTSGTTSGLPKGVPITHRNLVPLIEWQRVNFSLSEKAKTLQTLSFSFDVGLLEVLGTVLSGGTLYLEGDPLRFNPDRYIDYVNRHGINMIHVTPSYMRELLDGNFLKSVNVIMLIGETLKKELLIRLLKCVPAGCRVYNAYGPTEATIFATMFQANQSSNDRFPLCKSVPIGTCTADSTVRLLDVAGQPVPKGVHGEIYIGGPGIGLGYLNQPELTASRFLPDPFSMQPGARLYQTGDMAISLADGDLEFLGRFDLQVKIRGFRVEPQEVETVLTQHSAVSEAAVLPYEVHGKNTQLRAYLVAVSGQRIVASELLRFARGQIPDYMLPAELHLVNKLPRTSNGKLDRRAVQRTEGVRLETRATYAPPQTDLEKIVANVWRDELKVDQIGVNDNFFDLGGHSLMASRVHTRLVEHWGKEFPLAVLFEHTDTRSLAGYLSSTTVEQPLRGQSSDVLV